MAPARLRSTTVTIDARGERPPSDAADGGGGGGGALAATFRASGMVVESPG